jgi:hypothetical protein
VSDDIEVVSGERVTCRKTHTRHVQVTLVDRPDIIVTDNGDRYAVHLGRVGERWVPSLLDITYEKVDDQPWTAHVTLTVWLRLKSGRVSEKKSRDHIGFEVGGDWRNRPYGQGWPYIDMPAYVPGIVKAHAPEGWRPPLSVDAPESGV